MSNEYSENVSEIPSGCEFRSDCLSYSYKSRWMPTALLYSSLVVFLLGVGYIIYGIVTGQYASISGLSGFNGLFFALICILSLFSLAIFLKAKGIVTVIRSESRNYLQPKEFASLTKNAVQLLIGIGVLLFGVVYEILRSVRFTDIPSFILAVFFLGAVINVFIVLTVNYEISYSFSKDGFYYELRKLFRRKTQNFIPLCNIDRFILNTKVEYDNYGSSTTCYFVSIINQYFPMQILEYTESEKYIPEWFVSSGNSILANLTGRDIEPINAVPCAPSPAPSAGYSGMAANQDVFDLQNFFSFDSSLDNNQYINQPSPANYENNNPGEKAPQNINLPVPPNCEIQADCLTYLYKQPVINLVLSGSLILFGLIASICVFTGVITIDDNNASTKITVVLVLLFSLIGFLTCFMERETGRLDTDGFHLENRSLLGRSTQNIPLDSIHGFRAGSREVSTRRGTAKRDFVEIVTSEKPLCILDGCPDNNLREWLVNSGNALLANLKRGTMDAQQFKESSSDDSMDVSDFNSNLEE